MITKEQFTELEKFTIIMIMKLEEFKELGKKYGYNTRDTGLTYFWVRQEDPNHFVAMYEFRREKHSISIVRDFKYDKSFNRIKASVVYRVVDEDRFEEYVQAMVKEYKECVCKHRKDLMCGDFEDDK
jgi:hypothetical protein